MVKSTGFRLASILIPTLLLFVLGGVIYMVLQENRATPLPTGMETPTAPDTTPESSPSPPVTEFLVSDTPPVALDGRLRYNEAGIAFGPPQGYTLDLADQAAILTATDDSPAAETILVLRKEHPDDYANADLDQIFDEFVRFYAAQDGFALGESAPVAIGGEPGLAVDLLGQEAGDFGGRIALTRPAADHLFVMIGVGPAQIWRGQGLADFMAVLETIAFLDLPGDPPDTERENADEAPNHTVTEPAPDEVTPEPEPTPTFTPQAATPEAAAPEIEDESGGAAIDIPPADTPEPVPERRALDPERWSMHTNGNFVNGLDLYEETLWAATTGGAVAWNLASGNHAKFTTADGLSSNHLNAVAACDLPDLGVVLGSDQGLQIYVPESATWRTLSTQGGELAADDVVDLYCDTQAGYLAVLYGRDGVDLFHAQQSAWLHLALDMASLGEEVGLLRRIIGVPGGDAFWIAAQRGLLLIQGDFMDATDNGAIHDVLLNDVSLTVFTPENSPLTSAPITALTPAGENSVWLAGNGAVYRTDGMDWETFTQDDITGTEFPQGRINGLAVDGDNLLWIASDQTNICRFDPVAAQCVAFFVNQPGMVSGPLSSLALDDQGRPYYGALGNGVSRYTGSTIGESNGENDSVWSALVVENQLSMGNTIRSLAASNDGAIWIGASAGATQIAPQDLTPTHYTPANSGLPFADIAAIGASAQDNGVWVGAHGAARFDGNAWTAYSPDDNLVDAPIQTIAADGVGRTWLGSQGAGISIWTGSSFFNLTAANGIPSEEITALASGGDLIWIGTRGGGLFRFQNNQLRFYTTASSALPSNNITALAMRANGELLIGTDRGLARYAAGEIVPSAEMPSGAITALAVPHTDTGTGADTGTDSNDTAQYWAVQEGQTLYWYAGDELFEIDTPPGWSHAPITALLLDEENRLWVGFQRGGIALYSP